MSDEHSHEHIPEGLTLDELESQFSSLASELKDGKIEVKNLIENKTDQKPNTTSEFSGYDPSINDFLARAKTEEECLQIIEHCLSQGDITAEEANNLKQKLSENGPNIFGDRNPGYYDKN